MHFDAKIGVELCRVEIQTREVEPPENSGQDAQAGVSSSCWGGCGIGGARFNSAGAMMAATIQTHPARVLPAANQRSVSGGCHWNHTGQSWSGTMSHFPTAMIHIASVTLQSNAIIRRCRTLPRRYIQHPIASDDNAANFQGLAYWYSSKIRKM